MQLVEDVANIPGQLFFLSICNFTGYLFSDHICFPCTKIKYEATFYKVVNSGAWYYNFCTIIRPNLIIEIIFDVI